MVTSTTTAMPPLRPRRGHLVDERLLGLPLQRLVEREHDVGAALRRRPRACGVGMSRPCWIALDDDGAGRPCSSDVVQGLEAEEPDAVAADLADERSARAGPPGTARADSGTKPMPARSRLRTFATTHRRRRVREVLPVRELELAVHQAPQQLILVHVQHRRELRRVHDRIQHLGAGRRRPSKARSTSRDRGRRDRRSCRAAASTVSVCPRLVQRHQPVAVAAQHLELRHSEQRARRRRRSPRRRTPRAGAPGSARRGSGTSGPRAASHAEGALRRASFGRARVPGGRRGGGGRALTVRRRASLQERSWGSGAVRASSVLAPKSGAFGVSSCTSRERTHAQLRGLRRDRRRRRRFVDFGRAAARTARCSLVSWLSSLSSWNADCTANTWNATSRNIDAAEIARDTEHGEPRPPAPAQHRRATASVRRGGAAAPGARRTHPPDARPAGTLDTVGCGHDPVSPCALRRVGQSLDHAQTDALGPPVGGHLVCTRP